MTSAKPRGISTERSVVVPLNSAPPWIVAALLRHLGTKSITLTDEDRDVRLLMTTDDRGVTLTIR